MVGNTRCHSLSRGNNNAYRSAAQHHNITAYHRHGASAYDWHIACLGHASQLGDTNIPLPCVIHLGTRHGVGHSLRSYVGLCATHLGDNSSTTRRLPIGCCTCSNMLGMVDISNSRHSDSYGYLYAYTSNIFNTHISIGDYANTVVIIVN